MYGLVKKVFGDSVGIIPGGDSLVTENAPLRAAFIGDEYGYDYMFHAVVSEKLKQKFELNSERVPRCLRRS
jgi:hypothetical protein